MKTYDRASGAVQFETNPKEYQFEKECSKADSSSKEDISIDLSFDAISVTQIESNDPEILELEKLCAQ